MAPSSCQASPKSTRSRRSRSIAGKSRETDWAYCQTCWHVPGQQSTPSQPQKRPLSKAWKAWVARQFAGVIVRTRNQSGSVESYQVRVQRRVWSESRSKFSAT